MKPDVKRKKEHIDKTYKILSDANLTCLEKINAMYLEIKDYEFYK